MGDGLRHMSTAELVHYATANRYKFRSVSINSVLGQLISRAISVLQDQDAFPVEDDEIGSFYSKELEGELAALYADSCYSLLVRILSSTAVDPRALAGATYLLALLTAGSSAHAENLRNKMAKGVGAIRLVALMSVGSESVECNALLVLGNLLRHSVAVHSEFMRLGGIRKLAVLFRQAHEEPQKNVCMDALLCLCNSSVPGVAEELMRTGCLGLVLELVNGKSSERVLKKAFDALSIMLSKDSATRSSILELSLVKPTLSALQTDVSEELLLTGLGILRDACQAEDGVEHRRKFMKHGGMLFVLSLLQNCDDLDTIFQGVDILASMAALDGTARQEVSGNRAFAVWISSLLSDIEHLEHEQPEHVAALRFLLTVSNSNWQQAEAVLGNATQAWKDVRGHARSHEPRNGRDFV